MKLFIHSQTSTVTPLVFGNIEVISSHTLLVIDYLSMLTLSLIRISEVWAPEIDAAA